MEQNTQRMNRIYLHLRLPCRQSSWLIVSSEISKVPICAGTGYPVGGTRKKVLLDWKRKRDCVVVVILRGTHYQLRNEDK
eukprot:scaffold39586_cov59-Cyclotella_meneghiniana.AAC.2